MTEADLNFLARQNERLMTDVASLRDDNAVLTAIVTRLDGSAGALLAEMPEQAVMALFTRPARLLLLLVAAFVIAGNAAAQTPTAIAAPDEATVVTLHAEGAQIYECKAGSDGERRAAMASPSLYERSARNRFSTHPGAGVWSGR